MGKRIGRGLFSNFEKITRRSLSSVGNFNPQWNSKQASNSIGFLDTLASLVSSFFSYSFSSSIGMAKICFQFNQCSLYSSCGGGCCGSCFVCPKEQSIDFLLDEWKAVKMMATTTTITSTFSFSKNVVVLSYFLCVRDTSWNNREHNSKLREHPLCHRIGGNWKIQKITCLGNLRVSCTLKMKWRPTLERNSICKKAILELKKGI